MEEYKLICEKQEKHIDYLRNRCFNLIDELSRKTDEHCKKELKYIEEITALKEQVIKLNHDLLLVKLNYGGNK